jgi:hypothetical protein
MILREIAEKEFLFKEAPTSVISFTKRHQATELVRRYSPGLTESRDFLSMLPM